jgi:hypothetical protein
VGVGAAIASLPAWMGLARARSTAAMKGAARPIEPAGLDWIVAGIAGQGLTGGYRVANVSPIRDGAVTLALEHTDGSAAQVQIFRRSPLSRGLATTNFLDLRLMNDAAGAETTHEGLGVAVLTLAAHLRRVEAQGLRSGSGLDAARRASLRSLHTHERHYAMYGGFVDGQRRA